MDFDDILDKAEELTNAELDSKISSYTRLTDEDVGKLFPTKQDKENLLELLKIVRSAASENKKKARVMKNIKKLAGTVVKLVKMI